MVGDESLHDVAGHRQLAGAASEVVGEGGRIERLQRGADGRGDGVGRVGVIECVTGRSSADRAQCEPLDVTDQTRAEDSWDGDDAHVSAGELGER